MKEDASRNSKFEGKHLSLEDGNVVYNRKNRQTLRQAQLKAVGSRSYKSLSEALSAVSKALSRMNKK